MANEFTILIVNDDLLTLKALARLLGSAGYGVIEASTGYDGLRLTQERKPDLILLDISLPDIDGIEVCQRIKADPELNSIMVIHYSALRTSPDNQVDGFAAGADGYITHPINNRAFLAWMHTYIRLKKTEDTLRHRQARSEEGFRLLVDSLKDYAIVMLDQQGYIVSWNSGAERIKGYRAEEIVGKKISIFYPESEVLSGKPDECLKVATLNGRYEEEGWRVRKDGSLFWANVIITAMKDAQGNLSGFAKITRDISEHKRGEEALRLKNDALIRSNNELEQFAYVASHDLQEPLKAVIGFCQLLKSHLQDKLDTDTDKYIKRAICASKRMQKMIEDLLALSRISTGGQPFQLVDCELLIINVLTNLQVMIEESKVKIIYGKLPTVLGDNTQLYQLFQNIIINAIKFRSHYPPEISIEVDQNPTEWLFAIHDNGIGINPDHHERIFKIFQRLHTISEFTGTGIGLAICKKIVERHGGQIWVQSECGKGATFYFTIAKSKSI